MEDFHYERYLTAACNECAGRNKQLSLDASSNETIIKDSSQGQVKESGDPLVTGNPACLSGPANATA